MKESDYSIHDLVTIYNEYDKTRKESILPIQT